MYRTRERLTRIGLIAISLSVVAVCMLIASGPCGAQYPPGSYGAKLEQNLAAQNNLKGNINLMLRLREQARYQAELARTAGDRQAFNHWKGRYNELQQRISQYRHKLRNLEVQEQQLRGAAQTYGPNAAAGTGGGPTVYGSGPGGAPAGGYGSGSGTVYGSGSGGSGPGGRTGSSAGRPAGGGSGGSSGGDCKGVDLLGNCVR